MTGRTVTVWCVALLPEHWEYSPQPEYWQALQFVTFHANLNWLPTKQRGDNLLIAKENEGISYCYIVGTPGKQAKYGFILCDKMIRGSCISKGWSFCHWKNFNNKTLCILSADTYLCVPLFEKIHNFTVTILIITFYWFNVQSVIIKVFNIKSASQHFYFSNFF